MPGEIEKAAALTTGPLRLSVRSESEGLFRISHLTLSISGLPKQFDGYRLVQLTDLHFGPATSAAHIERAVEITNSLKPQTVLLTGDYVQFSATGLGHKIAKRFNPKAFRWIDYRREVRELAHRLGKLLAPLSPADGIFGVFGNHDHLEGLGSIIRQLPSSIQWLNNANVAIQKGGSKIILAGIDDLHRGKPNLFRALDFALLDASERVATGISAEGAVLKLLLSHNPDLTIALNSNLIQHVDLMLCGHTHGGQIRLPLFGAPVTRTKQKNHVSGLSYFKETAIYVSNGVGYGAVPIRFLCPPEIVCITLQASS